MPTDIREDAGRGKVEPVALSDSDVIAPHGREIGCEQPYHDQIDRNGDTRLVPEILPAISEHQTSVSPG